MSTFHLIMKICARIEVKNPQISQLDNDFNEALWFVAHLMSPKFLKASFLLHLSYALMRMFVDVNFFSLSSSPEKKEQHLLGAI